MGGIYVSRKTPHCREFGELRKGATGLWREANFETSKLFF